MGLRSSSITPVRQLPAIGWVVTDKCEATRPPVLAPLRNPIYAWNTEYGWQEAFKDVRDGSRMDATSQRFPRLPPVDTYRDDSVHGSPRGNDQTAVWGRGHFSLMQRPKFGALERETMGSRGLASHTPVQMEFSVREKEVLRLANKPIQPLTPGVLKDGRTDYDRMRRRVGTAKTTNGLNLWETSSMAMSRAHHGLKAFA